MSQLPPRDPRLELLDNFTHTLVGLVAADLALQLRAARAARHRLAPEPLSEPARAGDEGRFRPAALWTSALANNLPDFDFLYTGITGGKLGYLLHHRGHTHTLALGLPLALVGVGSVLIVLRALGTRLDAGERRWLVGLALLGGVLHIAMDFGNNYGVHPFWPIDNRWYYGDVIFIVEPWLILILSGSVFWATSSRVLRGILAVCVAGLLALAARHELGGLALAGGLATFAAGWFAWTWRAAAARRALATVSLLSAFGLVWIAARQAARGAVASALVEQGVEDADLVSTPFPGNPLCWWVMTPSVSDHDRYVVRQAAVAPWPALLDAEHCVWPVSGTTAPLREPQVVSSSPSLRWGPEFHGPIEELRGTAQTDCVARAALRFLRVPFWIQEDGRTHLIGDLRYDRSAAIDFAEMVLEPSAPCPRFVPPWEPPFSLGDLRSE